MERISPEQHRVFDQKYKEAKRIAPTIDSEWILVQQARNGNNQAAQLLYNLNYPLLIKYINTSSVTYYEGSMVDLLGVAYTGLPDAIRLYDRNYNVHFSSIFIPHAAQKVREFLKKNHLMTYPDTKRYAGMKIDVESLNVVLNDNYHDMEMIDTLMDEHSHINDVLGYEHTKQDVKKIISKAPDKKKLQQIFDYITDGPTERFTKANIARHLKISTNGLDEIYKRTKIHRKKQNLD